MAPVSNKRIVFKAFLEGPFVVGQNTEFDDNQTIDADAVSLSGGILLKTLVLSLEPYVLGAMWAGSPISYSIGDAIQGYGVGVIVRSENSAFRVGDHVFGLLLFQEYAVYSDTSGLRKIDNKHGLPWSVFVGIAGMAGQTAYYGWKEYSRAKKGEVAFVTSGAGGVGSLVIQLAKRDGMKVIASAGSDDKVQFLKELGADVAFNYKTTKTAGVLAKEGPIDVYWDNVGGETLEAALNAARKHARFIECGMISGYSGEFYPIRNMMNIVAREILLQGFVFSSLSSKYLEAFNEEVPALVASKELIHRENVARGLENAEVAFDSFLKGAFIGKVNVVVADE